MKDKKIVIDVREIDEYAKEHVPGSINVPLSRIEHIKGYKDILENKSVHILCASGKRASIAKDHFDQNQIECKVIQGGIAEWKRQGNPIITLSKNRISIFRQVQIIVGTLVFIFSLLAYFISPLFSLIAGFIGMMLAVAGVFGFCLLATGLSKMPWNKAK